MSEGLIAALIGILAAPLAVFVTWMANRKKHMADIYGVLTTSSQAAVETMQTAMDTLHEELEHAVRKIEHLETQIEKLRNENKMLLAENTTLHAKIDQLMRRLPDSGLDSI